MKGDINLKISKNHALLLVSVLSIFSMANFVSLVDAKSAGGIVIEKETMDVGSVVLRMDNKNPADIYGGTWSLIQGDASLRLGNGTNYDGSVNGSSEVSVPLPAHSHTFTGNPLPPHSHDYTRSRIADIRDHSASQGHWLQANVTLKTNAVSAGTPTGAISTEGVSDAKINVKGSYIFVNVWKRIN
jgi:hypothetical protein